MFRPNLIRSLCATRFAIQRGSELPTVIATQRWSGFAQGLRNMSSKKKSDKGKTEAEQVTDDGFNIFEQLKSKQQQSKQGPAEEENPENMDPKEQERIRRRQESAEKEINERQAKTFGRGTLFLGLSVIATYAYLGMIHHSFYDGFLIPP